MNPMRLVKRAGRASARRALLFALTLSLLINRPALAANIVVDGQFGDWAGQPFITDPLGDASPPRTDLFSVYWATNPGDPTAYFMIQRAFPGGQGGQNVFYRIFIDTACNGSYNEASDRVIFVAYNPTNFAGTTVIIVSSGAGAPISGDGGNWGDPANGPPTGGTRTEFGVSFNDLGITTNQTICFYVATYQTAGSTTPSDSSLPVQWAPVPALGYPLAALVVVGVIVYVWRRRLLAAKVTK
jgi:hypothetical protein